ncbi:retrotransposon hot spot (RHS) protein [Trypanosoma cruzi Dm28c]|uniref:Retrotransposon hot spot (RHS) protein n=2 Tax=Trypanosoma cruzi TaxID=5693 RepID=V5CIB1_TRYCR|nr:retrotransposon hot spot (RHS) protein [Trypanosoma cruzi Dm28c]
MKLSDFLTRELDGRGIVATNRDVLLKEFFKDPTKYIRGKGALNEMQASGRYLSMERALKGELIFDEDIRKLCDKGVNNLPGWSLAAAEVTATVHNSTKHFLDAAAEEARKPTTTIEPIKMEGVYESVHNARWCHVVEVPGGEGTGMEVKEGKPKQSWTYKAVGESLEKDDGVQQSRAPRPRLMVLTSEKGRAVLVGEGLSKLIPDCYVNCEVERVWQIVKGDLTELFSSRPGTYFEPKRRVLIGTPGFGNSLAADSYLLYQLLHYDSELLPVVVHCFVGGVKAYVFDKTTETVTRYMDKSMMIKFVKELSWRGMKGYIIYELGGRLDIPSPCLPPEEWGMLVAATPETTSYIHWVSEKRAVRIIMNCPDESDVKAMCVWKKRNQPV